MKTLILSAALCACALSSRAADPLPVAEVLPKTKLEQFQAKTGSVIIMGFSEVGTVSGKFNTRASVELREFTDASTGAKQSGVLITIREARSERERVSYVDTDEVASLIAGIDYIAKVTRAASLPSFQADYRTRGDLDISVYSEAAGTISAAIKTGRIGAATAFVSLKELADFRLLLQKAQAALLALK